MPTAVIELAFDPVLRIGDAGARLETLGIGVAILVALLIAARVAGQTPADPDDPRPHVGRPHLRRDDLLFIVLGIVPGAVVAGRLGYAVIHVDYYSAHPAAVVDPAQGGLELATGILGGMVTGAVVARLLEGPVGRWVHGATLPMLAAVALGKLAAAFGGDGQGRPADLPWATAYVGPGPWASLAPATPSHPAQLYEAAATAVVLVVMVVLLANGTFSRRDGRAFLVGFGLFAVARAAVASTWRDAAVLGPLSAAQLVALVLGLAALAVAAVLPRLTAARARLTVTAAEPSWPDPATRPRL